MVRSERAAAPMPDKPRWMRPEGAWPDTHSGPSLPARQAWVLVGKAAAKGRVGQPPADFLAKSRRI
jgi:hypothetical protein